MFEASVAGGIPIIKALEQGLSANNIESVAGIINGTGNFILTDMKEKGRDFNDVLKEAQALGYAEEDPTFDIEGIDAAHKLSILAAIAFGTEIQFDKIYTKGISEITTEDILHATELGYTIKHLGIAKRTEKGIELRVHPTLVPNNRLIARVNGVMNAVMVKSDALGKKAYTMVQVLETKRLLLQSLRTSMTSSTIRLVKIHWDGSLNKKLKWLTMTQSSVSSS